MNVTDALRRSFVAGLVLIAPLLVTLYVIRLLVTWSLQVVDPVVEGTRLAQYTADHQPPPRSSPPSSSSPP